MDHNKIKNRKTILALIFRINSDKFSVLAAKVTKDIQNWRKCPCSGKHNNNW